MSSEQGEELSPQLGECTAGRYVQGSPAPSRRRVLWSGGAGLAGAALLGIGVPTHALARDAASATSRLGAEIDEAARAYGVPSALLLAMGYVNTRLEMPPPEASAYRKGDPSGRGTYGTMALVRNPFSDTLGEAARLTGVSADRLTKDRAANIAGGAALLASSQGRHRPARPARWMGAVHGNGGGGRRYTATAGVGAGELYAGQVNDALVRGFSVRVSTGELISLTGRGVH